MKQTLASKRHIGIELLRVVSMLMIVTLHWGGFGIHILELKPFSFEWFFAWGIRGFAYMSVNIFVLISSFFLSVKAGTMNKIIQLWFEVIFYSLGIFLLCTITGSSHFSLKELFRFSTPILSNAYWFITSYIGMVILSPFLNISLNALTEKQHRYLCLVLFVFFSIVPNFFFWSRWLNWGNSCGIVWFVVLYVIGSYNRRRFDEGNLHIDKSILWKWTVLFWFLPIISKVAIGLVKQALTGDMVGSSVFYMNNSVIILGGSILTFMAFMTLEIQHSNLGKIILILAQGSLAVYLIHEHDCLRDIIWNFVGMHTRRDSLFIVIDYFAAVTSIFFICQCIDYIRRLFFTWINIASISNSLSCLFNKLLKRMCL